jgi:hypothetical protein
MLRGSSDPDANPHPDPGPVADAWEGVLRRHWRAKNVLARADGLVARLRSELGGVRRGILALRGWLSPLSSSSPSSSSKLSNGGSATTTVAIAVAVAGDVAVKQDIGKPRHIGDCRKARDETSQTITFN